MAISRLKSLVVSVPRGANSQGLLIALTVVTLLAFRDSFAGFVEVWSNRGFYSHGYLIAAICAYLLWRDNKDHLPGSLRVSPLFAFPLAAVSLVWFVARLVHVQVVELFLIPLLFAILIVSLVGFRAARGALFPLAFLYFAVPFWDVFNSVAQRMTVIVVEQMLAIARVPAFIEGNMVTIPEGRFEVAAGCSGLHYSLVMLTLTVLYGHLTFRTLMPKVLVVALGMGLALATNWARVFIIILVGHLTEMQHGLIANHDNFGWMIFGVVIIPFLLLARRLPEWSSKDRAGPGSKEAAADSVPAVAGGMKTYAVAAGFVVAGALLGPALEAAVSRQGEGATVSPRATLPGSVEGWQRQAGLAHTWQPQFSGATAVLAGRYAWDAAKTIDLYMFVYLNESQGNELVSDDNRVAGDESWRELELGMIHWRDPAGAEQPVLRRVISDGKVRREVWSYYEIGGYRVTRPHLAKLLQVAGALRNRRDNALIAISAECAESCESAASDIRDFLDASAPVLSNLLGRIEEPKTGEAQ